MIFSSIVFLFCFLPLVIFLYFITPSIRLKNIILLIFSFIFYSFGDIKALPLLISVILITYIGAICIEKTYEQSHRTRFLVLWLFILLDLAGLFYFKYFNFFLENINYIPGLHFQIKDIMLPLGISFYTFQAISYLADTYNKKIQAQRNILKFALYISFFPQLIAGPIIKYRDIKNQIDKREISFENIGYGLQRFICGMAKKILIADILGETADKVFSSNPGVIDTYTAWIGSACDCLQVYFDFSAYSDMAIGLGYIFGFKILENFKYPYYSKSMSDFWRRWHISLFSWVKEYLYTPLGGNIHYLRNLFIVFTVIGLWHGANWTFICFGLYSGLITIMERYTKLYKPVRNEVLYKRILRHIYFIIIIIPLTVFSNSPTLSYAYDFYKRLLNIGNLANPVFKHEYYFGRAQLIVLIIAVLCATPLFKNLFNRKTLWGKSLSYIYLLGLFILSVSYIARYTYNPFIYFRF